MKRVKIFFFFILLFLYSCLGVGKRATFEEYLEPLSYDKAFTSSLKAAEEMADECSKINPFNFPTVVSLGTSKSRG